MWQGTRGTTDGAMGYALTVLDRMQTDVEERFRAQTRALQIGCQEGEEFGRNPQMQNLMGRTRYLWERNIALQLSSYKSAPSLKSEKTWSGARLLIWRQPSVYMTRWQS